MSNVGEPWHSGPFAEADLLDFLAAAGELDAFLPAHLDGS